MNGLKNTQEQFNSEMERELFAVLFLYYTYSKITECREERKMKAESIILDVDGTLWDTTEIVAKSWNRAIHEKGIKDISVTADVLKQLFGRTMKAIAEAILGDCPDKKQDEIMDLCCKYEHEDLDADPCDVLYPGVKETIIELSKTHRVYIVSNCQSGYIEMFLKKTNLGAYVEDIECYGNTGKCKGDNIRLLMERNQVTDVVYVGDTMGDYEASVHAGVPFVFAEYGFGNVPESRIRIKKFSELLNLEAIS